MVLERLALRGPASAPSGRTRSARLPDRGGLSVRVTGRGHRGAPGPARLARPRRAEGAPLPRREPQAGDDRERPRSRPRSAREELKKSTSGGPIPDESVVVRFAIRDAELRIGRGPAAARRARHRRHGDRPRHLAARRPPPARRCRTGGSSSSRRAPSRSRTSGRTTGRRPIGFRHRRRRGRRRPPSSPCRPCARPAASSSIRRA